MAQSIKVDIRGDAGSLVKALKQSETAMRRLQAATKGLAAQDKLTNSAAVALTAALQRNAAAMETRTSATAQNTNATRVNTSANEDLGGSLQRTNIRLGQANAGFYNVAFAMEDAGQFANGFSAGMRAIGNNLSAIALSLSASGASFADFRTFLAGPGGLIIAISAFTAAAQLVPALMDKIGDRSNTAGGKLSAFADNVDDVRDKLPLLKADLEAIRNAFDDLINIEEQRIDFADLDLVEAKAKLSALEQEEAFLTSQANLANQILDATTSTRGSLIGVAGISNEITATEQEILYFKSLSRETLEEIARKSAEERDVIGEQTASLREKIRAEEGYRAVQDILVRNGYAIKEQTEETAKAGEDVVEQVGYQRQGLEGLVSLSYRLLENENIRLQVSKRIENSLQRRAVFSQAEGGGLAFQGFQRAGARPEGGLRQAGKIGRLDLDPVDDDIKRIGSQFDQLQSSAQSGMASFAGAILTGEQSVSSAFGSFFAMMGNQLIQLGIANIGLGTAGEALRAFVTNPALAIAAGAALLAIGGQLRKRTRNAQTNITSGRGGSISTGSAFVRDPYALSNQRNPFFGGGGASPFNVGYIAPPPPPSNPYAEIRMDAKDFVVSFDDARRELDMVS